MILLSFVIIKRRVTAGKAVFALFAALVAAGCQTNTPQTTLTPDNGQWISAEQAELEYKDEARKLTLAPGWQWPRGQQYESNASDGRKINYGVNTGRVDAAWRWHCSWAREYFNATSVIERDAALQQVIELKKSAFYRYGLTPEDKTRRDRILMLAKSGETDQLRDNIESNCPLKDVDLPSAS